MFPYINVFGRTIGMYGVCIALAILLVAFLSIRSGRKVGIPFEDVLTIGATAIGLALICGTALYIFVTFSIDEIIAMIKAGNFQFLTGGIVFYGGLIGGILGAFLGGRLCGRKISTLESIVIPYIPLGHAIGRVGCVMAGCCNGVPYEGPLALYYPHAITNLPPDQGYFPTQLLEAGLNTILCVVLLCLKKKLRRPYDVMFTYLGCYGVIRFVVEFFRGDAVRGIYFGVSTSQWISIGMVALCLVHFLFGRRKCAEGEVN